MSGNTNSTEIVVVVGSTNPVKINCVKQAFQQCFPQSGQWVFRGVKAQSNVSNQPMGNEETKRGAMNRQLHSQKLAPDANYYVGIEGGCERIDAKVPELMCYAWVVISDNAGKIGSSRTSTFQLPPKVAKLVLEDGLELGDADDIVFNRKNSKQANGAIGILTGDLITRTTYYVQAVILATIPFMQPDLFLDDVEQSNKVAIEK